MSQAMVFFKKLFNIPDWEIVIKNGKMIRTCRHSGRVEFRDCKTNNWIPIENATSNSDQPMWSRPGSYQVEDQGNSQHMEDLLKQSRHSNNRHNN
ncbi:MAG: hypothetical protein PVG66_04620 [Chromatiales bacterium]